MVAKFREESRCELSFDVVIDAVAIAVVEGGGDLGARRHEEQGAE